MIDRYAWDGLVVSWSFSGAELWLKWDWKVRWSAERGISKLGERLRQKRSADEVIWDGCLGMDREGERL